MKKKPKTKTIYFRLDAKLYKKLERLKRESGHLYDSETLRMIIAEYFKKQGAE